jgi:hypothetical protein
MKDTVSPARAILGNVLVLEQPASTSTPKSAKQEYLMMPTIAHLNFPIAAVAAKYPEHPECHHY